MLLITVEVIQDCVHFILSQETNVQSSLACVCSCQKKPHCRYDGIILWYLISMRSLFFREFNSLSAAFSTGKTARRSSSASCTERKGICLMYEVMLTLLA